MIPVLVSDETTKTTSYKLKTDSDQLVDDIDMAIAEFEFVEFDETTD